jgi:hypothetical protein
MPITGTGWELQVQRIGIQQSGARSRTYGSYQAYRDGQAVTALNGNICECIGPGDNSVANNHKRIEQGRYPLWTQFGRYRTIGYSTDLNVAGQPPMPALLVEGVGNRNGILIHPGHPPNLYLSSIGCFNPSHRLGRTDLMNFWDSRQRVIAIIDDLKNFDPNAFQHEVLTRIADAWLVVDGEPNNLLVDPVASSSATAMAASEPVSLPVSKTAAIQCCKWLLDNFGPALGNAIQGKTYKLKHLCGIVCQETAYKWLKWIGLQDTNTIVARCVFDASGDYPGTTRSAFPKNTDAFRAKYGDEFTNMLIAEANLTRRLQGWADQQWVYKGYGIFQYDLQNVDGDEGFFKNKQWYSFDSCLQRCCGELDKKLVAKKGDLWKAIAAYNGSGKAAAQYAANVKTFSEYCGEVTGEP